MSEAAHPQVSLLLAEDNPVNLRVALALIRLLNHAVDTATGGHDAVAKASRNRYDAILMDVQMPDMNGIAATRAIRLLSAPKRDVPIIVLTADSSPETAARCIAAGASAILYKPLKLAELRSVLKEQLDLKVDPPLTDAALLSDLRRSLDTASFQELLIQARQDIELRLVDARTALDAGTPVEAARAAHVVKSVADTFAMTRLADQARRFEADCAAQPGDLRHKLTSLEDLARQSFAALDTQAVNTP